MWKRPLWASAPLGRAVLARGRLLLAVKDDAPFMAEDLREFIDRRFGDYVRFAQDFSLLELGPRTSRVLHSLEALAVAEDMAATKYARQLRRKAARRAKARRLCEAGAARALSTGRARPARTTPA